MSKLWATFQTQYRLSVAYHVSVVLIESRRAPKTPLPVLRRGSDDRGPQTEAGVVPPFPEIERISVQAGEPSALLGEEIVLEGHHLAAATVQLRLRHRLIPDSPPVTVLEATDLRIRAQLDNSAGWLPGTFGVTAVISNAGQPDRTTNEVPLVVSPRITSPLPMTVARNAAGAAEIALTIEPPVDPTQRVSLLISGREVPAQPRAAVTGNIDFTQEDAIAGEFFIRVRVDGADTRLVNRAVFPPEFFATQKVTIT
jgi:hypothetical protein